ncbi:hypothetical protein [Clostridium sp.]|uniref:hypothetical protein n=1 Tax=Clostridium sp. TaxID=1506 RepID=UPI003F2DE02E
MNKKFKIIVLGTICTILLVGTVSLKNNNRNAEVTNIPSGNIDKFNENISSESNNTSKIEGEIKSNDELEVKDNEIAEDKNSLDTSSVDNTSGNNANGQASGNTVDNIPEQPVIPPKDEVSIPQEPNIPVEPPIIPDVKLPTIEELKQFMINYGIRLGKTYDPSLDGTGFMTTRFTETWSPWIGQEGGANQLFGDFDYKRFGITVTDLGNGWVEFAIYVDINEYFG